jgi:hypothetical protein
LLRYFKNESPAAALTTGNSGERGVTKFTMLLVEDELADLLKDEGFEVVECSTAEAPELIVASTGAELQALVTDQTSPEE